MKNISISILLLFLLFSLSLLFSDKQAITQDGKKVLLKDDGTWEYIKTDTELTDNKKQPLSIDSWNVTFLPEDWNQNRYNSSANLRLIMRNNTDKEIIAWRAILILMDPFDEELGKIRLTSGKSQITPNGTEEANFLFDDNPFIDDEFYNYFKSYDKDTLKLKLTNIKIVYKK